MYCTLYKLCSSFFLTRGLTRRIEHRMRILYPSNASHIYKLTVRMLMSVLMCGGMVIAGMIALGRISMYYVILTAAVVYVVIDNMVYEKLADMEYRLLVEFEKFITDVRFNFQYDGMIEAAIEEAVNSSEYIMAIHGHQISEYLREDAGKSDISEYKEVSPNAYFLTFYTLCETVMTFGDRVVDGQSCFMKNIGYIKDDIGAELINREKVRSSFMGLKMLSILPVFSIKLIETWAISNMSGMEQFYYSQKGSITTTAVIIIALCTYILINRLKYPDSFSKTKEQWIGQLLSNDIVENIVMNHIGRHYRHYFKMDRLLKSIASQYNVKEFLVKRVVTSFIAMIFVTVFDLSIGLLSNIPAMVISVLLCGLIAYHYHYMMILFKKQMIQLERENEIVRFQSVILILMHMEWTTVNRILNWLEDFASVFKYDIEKMNDQLCYKGYRVFEEMIQKSGFLPFERLLKSFLACDRVGIEDAFSGIESDRNYYFEKHKQMNEKNLNNRSVVAKAASFIPMCSVIAFELIIPFVMEGLKQLQSFTAAL